MRSAVSASRGRAARGRRRRFRPRLGRPSRSTTLSCPARTPRRPSGSGTRAARASCAPASARSGTARPRRRGVDVHGRHLPDALGPGPVRQDVRHRQLRPPARLVDVEAVLLEAGEIDDAEVRAARGHADVAERFELRRHPRPRRLVGEIQQVRGVGVVRRRLAQVVEARPDELAERERRSRRAP